MPQAGHLLPQREGTDHQREGTLGLTQVSHPDSKLAALEASLCCLGIGLLLGAILLLCCVLSFSKDVYKVTLIVHIRGTPYFCEAKVDYPVRTPRGYQKPCSRTLYERL